MKSHLAIFSVLTFVAPAALAEEGALPPEPAPAPAASAAPAPAPATASASGSAATPGAAEASAEPAPMTETPEPAAEPAPAAGDYPPGEDDDSEAYADEGEEEEEEEPGGSPWVNQGRQLLMGDLEVGISAFPDGGGRLRLGVQATYGIVATGPLFVGVKAGGHGYFPGARPDLGSLNALGVLGGVFGRKSFGYAMVGLGGQYFPAPAQGAVMVSIMGGGSIGGFNIGGSLDLSYLDTGVYSRNTAFPGSQQDVFTFGMHVGYAGFIL